MPSVVLTTIAFLLRKWKKRISSCRVALTLHSGLHPVTCASEQKEMTMAKEYKLNDYDVVIYCKGFNRLEKQISR